MSKRKYWTAEEKLQAILYLDSAESLTQACRELGIEPSMYYKWKKTYEEKGEESYFLSILSFTTPRGYMDV